MDVPFHIPNMQDIFPEPRNFLGVCLNFVDMLASMVNNRGKSKGGGGGGG